MIFSYGAHCLEYLLPLNPVQVVGGFLGNEERARRTTRGGSVDCWYVLYDMAVVAAAASY